MNIPPSHSLNIPRHSYSIENRFCTFAHLHIFVQSYPGFGGMAMTAMTMTPMTVGVFIFVSVPV